jgi:hypothetical protein
MLRPLAALPLLGLACSTGGSDARSSDAGCPGTYVFTSAALGPASDPSCPDVMRDDGRDFAACGWTFTTPPGATCPTLIGISCGDGANGTLAVTGSTFTGSFTLGPNLPTGDGGTTTCHYQLIGVVE